MSCSRGSQTATRSRILCLQIAFRPIFVAEAGRKLQCVSLLRLHFFLCYVVCLNFISITQMTSQGDQVPVEPNIIKDEQVWFDDGNLVVFVGPECRHGSPLKGDVYAFKSSRDFLSQHGHVFAAAFNGQNGDPNETFEGVQYVIMPDHWEDMRDFMRMIHGFS